VVGVLNEGQPIARLLGIRDIAHTLGSKNALAGGATGSAASNVQSTVAIFFIMVLAEGRSTSEIDARVVYDRNGIATSCPRHLETSNRNVPETLWPGPRICTPGATHP
jgi:hypothetical protein